MLDKTKIDIPDRNPGYWINAYKDCFCQIDEHASWIIQKQNIELIELDPNVYQDIKDFVHGKDRAKICTMVMEHGLIRCRRNGESISFEFTIPFEEALPKIKSFLKIVEIGGEFSILKIGNIKDLENPVVLSVLHKKFMEEKND